MSRKSRINNQKAAAAAQEQAAQRKSRFILALVIVLAVVMLGAGAILLGGGNDDSNAGSGEAATPVATNWVEIDIQGYGVITAELYGNVAPITVDNFVNLANEGFYDGLTFHRIIEGFMMQGGDPNGDGSGGSAQEIKGEFSANGVANPIAHERGVLSMARNAISMDSGSSQFFIVHQTSPWLDGQYAAFGRVVTGLDIVDAICTQTPVIDGNGTVLKENQPVINSIRVVSQPQSNTEK